MTVIIGGTGTANGFSSIAMNGSGTISGVSRISNVTKSMTVLTSGSGTYTVPAGVTSLKVRMVGGGGGGGGGGAGGTGTTGGTTTFGSSFLTCVGGPAGLTNGAATLFTPPAATIGAGATGIAISGTSNSPTLQPLAYQIGNNGGSSPFGGAGQGAYTSGAGAGSAGSTNSGSGGGGGGATGATSVYGGGGGGAGAYIEALITSPLSSYAYSVGAGGNAGTAGSNGIAGGAGGSGVIIIEEFYY